MAKKKRSWLEQLLDPEPEKPPIEDKPNPPVLQPALRQLGTTDCPICKHAVAVFLTKTNRPFINCGFCCARIFYNGKTSMQLLRKRMELVEED